MIKNGVTIHEAETAAKLLNKTRLWAYKPRTVVKSGSANHIKENVLN